MKRFCALLAILLLLLSFCVPAAAEEMIPVTGADTAVLPFPPDPIQDISLDCQGAYLINMETHTAVYAKCANARMYPASTTKIMTALIVLENCPNPDSEIITVPDVSLFTHILDDGGVHMEMNTGESFTTRELLYAMMLNSYCDAAELLAYHFGGDSVSGFVEMMNQKSASLGLENTNFENAHGLHSNNHYSSPADMARILEEALKDRRFVEIISARSATIPQTPFHTTRELSYSVGMFYPQNPYYMDSIIGGKSGFTDQAGRCLATFSQKNGISYILVLFGGNMDTSKNYTEKNITYFETNTLLSYAFESYELRTVFQEGELVASLPVKSADVKIDIVAPNNIDAFCRVGGEARYVFSLPEELEAQNVANGAEAGTVSLFFGESESVFPLIISYEGGEIRVKSAAEEKAEEAFRSIAGIFREDKVFVTLLILLLVVIAVCIPVLKITQSMHKKRSHRPKH